MARFVNRDVVVVPLPLTDFSEGRRKRQFGRAASSSLPEIAFVHQSAPARGRGYEAASSSLPEIAFVPKGHSRIAQRDNVGGRCRGWPVPKGRLSLDPTPSAVPSGRVPFSQLDPTLSRWAVAKCPSGTIPNLYSELDAALAIRGDSS